jgi:micrococcal nuclease
MQNLLQSFQNLPKYLRISAYVITGILCLTLLPAWLNLLVLAGLAYLFIDRKWIKYPLVVFLGLTAVVGMFVPDTTSVNKKTETIETNLVSTTTLATEAASTSVVEATSTAVAPTVEEQSTTSTQSPIVSSTYLVTAVIDGDTIDVSKDGKTDRIRLIGIDTPETDPRNTVECFGKEATARATQLMRGKIVTLESDPSQDNVDKYGRLLRYVFLTDGTNVNYLMVKEGFAQEYTYNLPYKYQSSFKSAQAEAKNLKLGLWGTACTPTVAPTKAQEQTSTVAPSNTIVPAVTSIAPVAEVNNSSCNIKGNISSDDEKIYHTTDCPYYIKTKIDTSKGERWFCSESEAVSAGWRKAKNCN